MADETVGSLGPGMMLRQVPRKLSFRPISWGSLGPLGLGLGLLGQLGRLGLLGNAALQSRQL